MSINIQTVLHNAQTYQDLLLVARQLCAGLSRWGYQYATVVAQSAIYQGTIAIGSVAEKAIKIRLILIPFSGQIEDRQIKSFY